MACSFSLAQIEPPKDAPTRPMPPHARPMPPQGMPTQPMGQHPMDQTVRDAAGKQISVDHGGNLNIGPNDNVAFMNQPGGGKAVMMLSAGWIFVYDGGMVYKIRQSDMKLVAKTEIGPDTKIEALTAPAHRTYTRHAKRRHQ